jgi:hypothetical protein
MIGVVGGIDVGAVVGIIDVMVVGVEVGAA